MKNLGFVETKTTLKGRKTQVLDEFLRAGVTEQVTFNKRTRILSHFWRLDV